MYRETHTVVAEINPEEDPDELEDDEDDDEDDEDEEISRRPAEFCGPQSLGSSEAWKKRSAFVEMSV